MTIKNGDIDVTKYEISEITTAHDFIEIKKGNSIITVLEANAFGFTDIVIKKDTIILKYMPTVIYKFVDEAFGYKIKLDTTVSVDNWRLRSEEREKRK